MVLEATCYSVVRSSFGSSFEARSSTQLSKVETCTLSPSHGFLAKCQLEHDHYLLDVDLVRLCIEGRVEEEPHHRIERILHGASHRH